MPAFHPPEGTMLTIGVSLMLVFVAMFQSVGRGAAQKQAVSTYPVSILWRSRVSYPDTPARKGFIINIDENVEAKDDFPEDHFVLEVLTQEWDPKLIARKIFDSTYGKFDLALADVMVTELKSSF